LGQIPLEAADVHALYKQLKGAIGWKGRSSKGAIALKKIRDTENISDGNSIVFGIDLGKNREIVYVYGLCKRT
jgi:hypothetical protein